jgi:hypothetical protein
MLEIHGDTELSNMESFNLKETKNGDNSIVAQLSRQKSEIFIMN